MPLAEIVQRGADKVGGIVKLAKLLGVNPATPYSWRDGIPRAHVRKFAVVTGIALRDVAPDLFKSAARGGNGKAAR